jgi:hypothetical protein
MAKMAVRKMDILKTFFLGQLPDADLGQFHFRRFLPHAKTSLLIAA